MRLEVLISAMYLNDTKIIEKTKCTSDVLIINQTDINDYFETNDKHKVRMISTTERGLANSRNRAIKNATGDICLLCDDDEVLVEGYEQIILNSFDLLPEADIIAFDLQKISIGISSPRYTKTFKYGFSRKIQRAPAFKTYASVQLAFRRERIIENNLLFDTRFGAGSNKISAGDETVWQVEAKRRGLKIFYVPNLITYVSQENSKWFEGLNERYYYDLGACLSVNYPIAKAFLKYYYVLFIHGSKLKMREQIKWLNAGIKGFGNNEYSYLEYCEVKNACHH